MKRLWNIIIRLCAAAVCGYGCSDDYTEIGNRWTEVNTRLIVIDTCTVEVSTASPATRASKVTSLIKNDISISGRSPFTGIIPGPGGGPGIESPGKMNHCHSLMDKPMTSTNRTLILRHNIVFPRKRSLGTSRK